jgi:G3E family GTPase
MINMTNDTDIQPADAQASQADFVILTLADNVRDAEKAVTDQLASAQRIIEQATKSLAVGRPLNSLGELQGAGMAVDAKVAHLESSAAAFKTAWNYLGRHFPYQGNPPATVQTIQAWFDSTVASSPRLQEIIGGRR